MVDDKPPSPRSDGPPASRDTAEPKQEDDPVSRARRRILGAGVYIVPAVLGTLLVSAHGQTGGSCEPRECRPNCGPRICPPFR
jgi:hypothetical protein